MARTRIKRTDAPELDLEPSRIIEPEVSSGVVTTETGAALTADGETIGGDIPNPSKNTVLVLAPGHVVEATDAYNWTAKILRRTTVVAGRAPLTAWRWSTLGYYATPTYAMRRVLVAFLGEHAGDQDPTPVIARLEAALDRVSPMLVAEERRRELEAAATEMKDPRDADRLRARARALIPVPAVVL